MNQNTWSEVIQIEEWTIDDRGIEYGPCNLIINGKPRKLKFPKYIFGAELPIATELLCTLKLVQDQIQILAIKSSVPPSFLKKIAAKVIRFQDGVIVSVSTLELQLEVHISFKVMNASGISRMSIGALCNVDATHSGGTLYNATKLNHPTAKYAFGQQDPSGKFFNILASPRFNWPGKNNWDCSAAFPSAPSGDFDVIVGVPSKLIKKVGIRNLISLKKGLVRPTHDTLLLLKTWQTVLREGTSEQVDSLQIDTLHLEIEWVNEIEKWRVRRLSSPRAFREPISECEIVEGVHGIVTSVNNPSEKKYPLKEEEEEAALDNSPAERSLENFENLKLAESHEIQREKSEVMVQIQDHQVGRLLARAKIEHELIEQGGICNRVPVVVRLASIKGNWYVRRIHRSYPHKRLSE